jgi:hypothetical protein
MAFHAATADSRLPRRRFGRAEKAALVVAAVAWALGAAAWVTESTSSSASQSPTDGLSFQDRFVPIKTPESLRRSAGLQSLDHVALARIEGKLRDAKNLLAQRLAFADLRAEVEAGTDIQPAANNTPPSAATAAAPEIPLPRSRPAAADVQVAAAPAAVDPAPRPDDRSVLQKLSDLLPNHVTLASLTPNSGLFQRGPDLAALGYDGRTAVYDISAHAVYLPNGTKLEAHSGMGSRRDDPEHVDMRMVGATPPATYELKPREQLFHGVRALRLLPIDGTSTLGRAGLLAHSFMLGPEGDSNGCVSIREYDRFRKAYDEGEITRLVVVPSLSSVQAAQHTTSQS